MPRVKSKVKIASAALVVLTAAVALFAGYSTYSPSMVAYAQTNSMQYSVNISTKPGIGSYLTNATGFTLYTFSRDTQNSGTSACTAGCTAKWPAFYAANLTLPSGLSASSFTVITRPDGSKQLAYDGWPLYYFINDMTAGETNGQGVGNVWYACTVPTPFASTASATTSASGSGW